VIDYIQKKVIHFGKGRCLLHATKGNAADIAPVAMFENNKRPYSRQPRKFFHLLLAVDINPGKTHE
jgi:hypothetical protein